MFSGIVEEAAVVRAFERGEKQCKLWIRSELNHEDTRLGDSIAVKGVCLTVVENTKGVLRFDVAEETLRRTTLGLCKPGERVNIERSLRAGGRVHGHFVFGHVDGVGELAERVAEGNGVRLRFTCPPELLRYLAVKGSISVDGVSLTLGEILSDGFYVYLVPHTLEVTTLSDLIPGSQVNIEIDMLARYVHAALEQRGTKESIGP